MNTPVTKSAPLAEVIEKIIASHLETTDKNSITNLYQKVIDHTQYGALRVVIEHCNGNRSQAAKIMGISRESLRIYLTKYFGSQYNKVTKKTL